MSLRTDTRIPASSGSRGREPRQPPPGSQPGSELRGPAPGRAPRQSRHHASGRDRLRPAPPRPARRRQRLRPAADAQRPEPWPSAACWGCWPPPRCWAQVGRAGIGRCGRSAVAAAPAPGLGTADAPGLGRTGAGRPPSRLRGPWGARKPEASRLTAGPRGAGVVPPGSAICAGERASFFFWNRYQCKAYRNSRFLIPEISYSKRVYVFFFYIFLLNRKKNKRALLKAAPIRQPTADSSARPRRAAGRGAAADRELAVTPRRLSARRAVRAP